jgi:hypothetical protein
VGGAAGQTTGGTGGSPIDAGPEAGWDGANDAGADTPAPTPQTTIPTSVIDFGHVDCGTGGDTRTLSFTNSGDGRLSYQAALPPGGMFALAGASTDGSLAGDVAPGATATLTIVAAPVPTTTAVGAQLRGTLAIDTNAVGSEHAQISIVLTAQGNACTLSCGVLTPCTPGSGAPYCANTQTDNANCGSCGNACGASQVCAGGVCALTCGSLSVCAPSSGNAYCANLMTDAANCGTCGNACGLGEVCNAGVCSLSCGALVKCMPSAGAPYCANTQTDNANCGVCGRVCSAGQMCSAGACALTCGALATCTPATGAPYCANTQTDNANCGTCGNACAAGQACSSGVCVLTCGSLTTCTPSAGASYCANTQTDNANCGTCGNACGNGQVCRAGACTLTCGSLTTCTPTTGAPYCANTQTDNANCGTCGNVCAAGQACAGGVCTATCSSSNTLCGGMCTNTGFDPGNCGTCGNTCSFSHGSAACAGGGCFLTACDAGYLDCNRSQTDGCEVDATADAANCGGCGISCGMPTHAGIDAGLVGHWHLDEGSGATSTDASGNGRTATLTGNPIWTTGYSGGGLSFNGSSNYLNAPLGTSFGSNTTLTATAWVYATSTTSGPIFGVTSAPPGGGWNMPFLSINGATVYGHLWQVNGNTPLSATVSLNAWHFLAITYNPSANPSERFYVDGMLAASASGTFAPSGVSNTLTTYTSGSRPAGVGSYLNGKIDELRAYNRALTASDISILYYARQTCSASVCGGCAGGGSLCGGVCTNLSIDSYNCGTCGTTCGAGETCVSGSCVCSSGNACGGTCVDTTTDQNHCGACGNLCPVVTCGSCGNKLAGWWRMDEGSGATSADASGANHPLALASNPTWTTGQSGNGLAFNGANYATATLGTTFGGNNAISASAWVYATSTSNGPIFGVAQTLPGGGWNMPFLSINGSTVYGWLWQVNGNTPLSATVSLNTWHMLTITYDPSGGGIERFYVDGVLSSSGTGMFSPSGSAVHYTTYIGGAKPSGVNSYLNGTIDEVRAYNRLLTAGEVALLYNARLVCAASTCSACPPGMQMCGGVCTNTLYDNNHCNACGMVCGGGTTCVGGSCQ